MDSLTNEALILAGLKAWNSIDSALVYRAALRRLGSDCLDSDRYRALLSHHRREFRYWRDARRGLMAQVEEVNMR